MIRLDKNENLYGFADALCASVFANVSVGLYPEYDEAVSRLARYFGVATDELMLTNGADEAIDCVMQAVSERLLVVPEPTFSMYEERASLYGYRVKKVVVGEKRVSLSSFALSESPTLTVIVNPANPSGVVYTADEIVSFAARQQGVVLVDETYAEFCNATVIGKRTTGMVVIRSFSKAWGIAGLRLGCVIADTAIIARMKAVRLPYSVNSVACAVLMKISENLEYSVQLVKAVRKDRLVMANYFRKKGIECRETAANFILVKPRKKELFIRYLFENDIVVRSLSGSMSEWVRITVAPESLQQVVFPIIDSYCKKEEKK